MSIYIGGRHGQYGSLDKFCEGWSLIDFSVCSRPFSLIHLFIRLLGCWLVGTSVSYVRVIDVDN